MIVILLYLLWDIKINKYLQFVFYFNAANVIKTNPIPKFFKKKEERRSHFAVKLKKKLIAFFMRLL